MAVFSRTGRHRGRAADALAAVRQEVQDAAEAALVDTWLPHLLRAAEGGLSPRLDGAPSAVLRAADLVLASAARLRRQTAEEVTADIGPVLDQLGRQATSLTAVQQTVLNEDALHHLYCADHAGALAARFGVRLTVLAGGGWPVRRRPAALREVGQAAQSRVADYERVEVRGTPALNVVAGAVEPLVAALAELLDNALRAGPQTPVLLEGSADPGGAAWLVVTDTGPGLPPETLAAVRRVLAGGGSIPPGTTWTGRGLRLVAAAARHLNFQVAVTSSPGRTTAGLLLPPALLTPPPAPVAPALRRIQ
ncbi:ATP-binding protein [Kitasatospora purpeofusca]|uniref:ATP-binding protein n=1 Tax=Kitasatospora purpeofusca TaxID=67352 RepID=UPI0035E27D5A